MCYCVLQCVAVRCSALQCVAVQSDSFVTFVDELNSMDFVLSSKVLQCVAVCCSALLCVAVFYSVLQCDEV